MDSLSATTPVATELSPPPGVKKSPSSKRGTVYAAPYIDMQSMDAVAMIQTICQHYKSFTKHEVKGAIVACKAQAMTSPVLTPNLWKW
jgi:hypothetical protein